MSDLGVALICLAGIIPLAGFIVGSIIDWIQRRRSS